MSCVRLALVGAQGSTGFDVGGVFRIGQEQGEESGPATPVFVQGGSLALEAAARTVGGGDSQLPMLGKEDGITPRSAHASLDKNGYGTDLET